MASGAKIAELQPLLQVVVVLGRKLHVQAGAARQFGTVELVKDKGTKETFTPEESHRILKTFLSKQLFENGLYCRADDRGDPVIQLSPPLIVGESEFNEMEQILRATLTAAETLL